MRETEKRSIKKTVKSYRDLEVYKMAMDGAMEIFDLSKSFPSEEKYSLTDQIRRSSRSVCANIGESWRKRRYKLSFISKLSDAETEAAETQIWLEFAHRCRYIDSATYKRLVQHYEYIIGKLVNMINNPKPWLLSNVSRQEHRRRTAK